MKKEAEENNTNIRKIIVDPKQEMIRIDKFLMDRLPQVSRNKIQEGIKDHRILVDDQPVKSNYKVRPGDVITVEEHVNQEYDGTVIPENIPLDVMYEDDYLMVINKPAGMVVHPGYGNYSGTLVNAVAYHLDDADLPVLDGNPGDRPGLVHRLDKDTSGLLVVAKNEEVLRNLADQFHDKKPERKYQAIVWGAPEPYADTIRSRITRHPKNRLIFTTVTDPKSEEGRDAVTHYRMIKDLYYVSLIECQLETGRTHQIRVHMSSVGHPVFNDHRYGGDRIIKGTVFSKYKQFVENCFTICPRQALHAASLGFVHPVSQEKLFFEAPLPQDMQTLLDRWERYVEDRTRKEN